MRCSWLENNGSQDIKKEASDVLWRWVLQTSYWARWRSTIHDWRRMHPSISRYMQSESDYEVRGSELSRFEMRYPQLDNGSQYLKKKHSTFHKIKLCQNNYRASDKALFTARTDSTTTRQSSLKFHKDRFYKPAVGPVGDALFTARMGARIESSI